MILITGLTLLLIWQTLESQKKVQKDQQMLAEIESNRARREIKPEINILFAEQSADVWEGDLGRTFRITVKKNTARELCFKFRELPPQLFYPLEFDKNFCIPEILAEKTFKICGPKTRWSGVSFTIYYKDEDGGQYEKDFTILGDDIHSGETKPTFAHPLKNIYDRRINPRKVLFHSQQSALLNHYRFEAPIAPNE
jgi:hypothetical protein